MAPSVSTSTWVACSPGTVTVPLLPNVVSTVPFALTRLTVANVTPDRRVSSAPSRARPLASTASVTRKLASTGALAVPPVPNVGSSAPADMSIRRSTGSIRAAAARRAAVRTGAERGRRRVRCDRPSMVIVSPGRWPRAFPEMGSAWADDCVGPALIVVVERRRQVARRRAFGMVCRTRVSPWCVGVLPPSSGRSTARLDEGHQGRRSLSAGGRSNRVNSGEVMSDRRSLARCSRPSFSMWME